MTVTEQKSDSVKEERKYRKKEDINYYSISTKKYTLRDAEIIARQQD